ncbi:dihydrofolate reductase family protein [Kibdelosporangium lantanae]
MGKIVVTAFVTLDGVIQAPGLPDEDRDGGFPHGGWTQPYVDPELERRFTRNVLAADALLIGRRTYDLFASFWPTASPEDPRAHQLNTQPKYVASHTLTKAKWDNTTVLGGDLVDAVIGLKRRYDEISVWGSGTLVPLLLRHDLIDEFLLMLHPIVLGEGKRLFPEGHQTTFNLVESTTTSRGVTILGYRRP